MDDIMNKRPSLQFYPADWRKDPQLQMCSMSTQGIWINLLCIMWEAEIEGEIAGREEELVRLIGCTPNDFFQFTEEIKRHNFGDVTNCNGNVTIINRRMKRVFLGRKDTKKRVKEHRNRQSNKNVTEVRHPASSSTSSSTTRLKDVSIFDKARKLFKGTKRGLQTEYENFCKHADHKEVLGLLIPAVENQIRWREQDGRYWKNFKTWINNRCWEETQGVDKIESSESQCIRYDGKQRCKEYGKPFRKDDTGQPYFICSRHNVR